uniref:Uncharacterized protein n=1 Tax=Nelumbo nucifera TaxID=4432 RepID=A0A822ZPR8_NELNU|nr:TPA_asm: hypothetical protein HUJ06_003146 [Nelumbo nucifera]
MSTSSLTTACASVTGFQWQDGNESGAWFVGSSFTPRPGSVDKFQRQVGSGDGASSICKVAFYSLGLGSVDKFQRQDGSSGEARVLGSSFTLVPSSVDKFQPQDGRWLQQKVFCPRGQTMPVQ